MTYDDYKLETPEDEAYRKGWRDYRDADRCWNCKRDWQPDADDEMRCAYCEAYCDDAPPEPDPDDARDAMMDRMLDQRWDSD